MAMEYDPSDSSGTDDDLPPTYQNRAARGGRVSGNGRPIVAASPYPRVQNDMEVQIHQLEQEAYSSVLRAFKAQSDAITWEKESLITELRKELRVSDKEHRELLSRVNADDVIRRIREWRQAGGTQTGLANNPQPKHDTVPSPSVSASRKRQKTSQSIPSLPLPAPSPALLPQPLAPSMQPSSSAAKKGAPPGPKGKKTKSGQKLPGAASTKSMQYPSAGPSVRGQVTNRNSSGALAAIEPAEAPSYDPLVGRKVMTRWPEDNSFYEAVITDYNPVEGLHALVYDINTQNETWEWVNLKEISPEDIMWDGEDPGINQWPGRGGARSGRGGVKKSGGRGGAISGAGRGRGSLKNARKDFPPTQNGIGKKNPDDIEILHTETLIKEVERVFGASHPDPVEIERAKKLLKEHEQSLIDAISRLADASDGESDGGHRFSRGQSMEQNRGWRNQPYTANKHAEGREGSDGDHMVGDGAASDYRHDGDDDDI
ncbi:protein EMSY-LIKE 3-like isoform X2 [Ananas comosus]|uniref:Protein EMSY-LIKE 3-like isoform X2 n=1 Tax=Ananas comosus TaxID=4615 RepID=A0A6P5G4P7_ANACO|nr:protein EMSY-LIKE 3-like isoform X2 [Ananas comosus]